MTIHTEPVKAELISMKAFSNLVGFTGSYLRRLFKTKSLVLKPVVYSRFTNGGKTPELYKTDVLVRHFLKAFNLKFYVTQLNANNYVLFEESIYKEQKERTTFDCVGHCCLKKDMPDACEAIKCYRENEVVFNKVHKL